MSEEKDFVTICVVCGKGVTRDELKYVNGRVFHPECYEKHGNNFLVLNQDLLNKSARTKIELVQLKNLKMRTGGASSPSSKPKKKTSKRKASKRKTRKSKRKASRTKRRTSKRRKVSKKKRTTRRTALKRRKTSRKKARRRPVRKTKRRTSKRKSRRRR